MKILITLLSIMISTSLTGCTPSPHPKEHTTSLEGKEWVPVNQNYMNKNNLNQKDF